MPISLSQRVDAQCPKCGTTFPIEFWIIIDAGERPDLAARCRDGSIFTATCPNGHTFTFGAPLLYHDRAREQLILAVPPGTDEQQARAIHAQLLPRLQAHLLAPFPAYLERTQVVPQPFLPAALSDDPEAALAEAMARAMPPLMRALQEFINADSWDESEQILRAHPELLGDDADQLLAQLIEAARAQNNADAEKLFTEHREYLRRARERRAMESHGSTGVNRVNHVLSASEGSADTATPSRLEPTFTSASRRFESAADELVAHLRELNIQSPEDLQRALREHPDLAEQLQRELARINPTLAALDALMRTDSPPAVLRAARVHPILLDDETLEQIRGIIANARQQGQEEIARHLEARLETLTQFKQSGMSLDDLAQFEQLVQNPELVSVFQELAQQGITSPEQLEQALRDRPDLREKLERAAAVGGRPSAVGDAAVGGRPSSVGDAAVGGRPSAVAIPTELQPLIEQIARLTRPSDMPRKVELCERALRLVQREDNPPLWAALQGELANALNQNPQGSRADNLEEAIRHYELALQVYTREVFPEQWATTQNNLANAYLYRIRGERAENLEEAIRHYELALQVYTREVFPEQWATTQNNLANAYLYRIRGERAENLEEAIRHYELALQVYTREVFPEQWATTQNNLAAAYRNRIRGERADNLEAAIRHYELALQVLTREAFPVEWAGTQNNLATAYRNRIRGERADNLEAAIRHYELALQVYTREAFPVEWAGTQNNLANAYLYRIRGERADNLEAAIRHYELALQVRTREAFPVEWAGTQNNLANAYRNRIRGERAENLEEAIRHYELALQVRTRAAFPEQWATTQNNLANAYSDRIRGERAENLEEAIRRYELALQVYTREAFPVEWAMMQNNLGEAYRNRIRGERAENLEEAIRHYELALQVRTREAFPVEWAGTQNNLANAYSDRIRGERAENLEEAIQRYELALQVYTREAFPEDWARTQNNLANAYLYRIRGERADNLEEAIRHYELALQVYTRDAFPTDWAMTQNNLANAYSDHIRGERAENLEAAIRHYELALQVLTREAFPREHRQTQRNLGNLYFGERVWDKALAAFSAAIQVGDELFTTAYTETGRRAEIAETSALYARAAYTLLQLHRPADALVQAEAGRARLLGEALALAEAEAHLPDALKRALAIQRQTIRDLEAEMHLPSHTSARRDDRDLAERLRAERAALRDLVAQIRREHPDFMPLGLTASQIAALAPDDGALVIPIITSHESAAFVIPHGAETVDARQVVRLDDFTDESLNALLIGTEDDPGWLRAYITYYGTAGWRQDLERLTARLWESFIAPIHARVQELGAQRVVLLPMGGLQLLPLHAASRNVNGARRYWLDDVEITYAPSAYALRASQQRAQTPTTRTAFIAGVSEYKHLSKLRYTRAEVEQISEMVGAQFNCALLLDAAATPSAVVEGARGAAYLHLSCHGAFAWGKDPLESALYLADDERLTLKEVLTKMDLRATRLVVLSACETGITDTRQSPDEYVGLPAGFLQAGAAGVISSLWTVDDMSTALLMMRFYENHLQRGQTPAAALRAAQQWLRDATHAELAELFATYRDTAPDAPTRMAYATAHEQMTRHALRAPKDKPYASPYYWAAFGMYGA